MQAISLQTTINIYQISTQCILKCKWLILCKIKGKHSLFFQAAQYMAVTYCFPFIPNVYVDLCFANSERLYFSLF